MGTIKNSNNKNQNNNDIQMCTWFTPTTQILADNLFLPTRNNNLHKLNSIKTNFKYENGSDINVFHNVLNFDNTKLTQLISKKQCSFINKKKLTNEEKIIKENNNKDKKIENIKNDASLQEAQKQAKITKIQKNSKKSIDKLGTVCAIKKYRIFFNDTQKNKILNWIKICDHFYNYCVTEYNNGSKLFNKSYDSIKKQVFDEYFKNILIETNEDVIKYNINLKSDIKNNTENDIKSKPIPYDMITDELRRFCANLQSCYTNLEKKNIKKFDIKKTEYDKKYRTILIPHKAINSNGIFITKLGKITEKINERLKRAIKKDKIKSDSRLSYDKNFDRFYLLTPQKKKVKDIENRQKYVALDPGVNIFQAFYGEKSCGAIGENMKSIILNYRGKIKKLQTILDGKRNRKKKKLKNKKSIKKRILKMEEKITNIVKEVHNKSAKYLCETYETILIPKFETQQMLKKEDLRKDTKYVLNRQSHYKFKQHLGNKSLEYGCKLYEVTEEYTSKCCGKCGQLSDIYDNERTKICQNSHCDVRINRDLNGARNILLKNHEKILKLKGNKHKNKTIETKK